MSKLYFILEDGQPMNGEFYDRAGAVSAVAWADPDAKVICFEPASMKVADVTGSIASEAYNERKGEYDDFGSMPEILQNAAGDNGEDFYACQAEAMAGHRAYA